MRDTSFEPGAFLTLDRAREINRLDQDERAKSGYLVVIVAGAALVGWIALAVAVGTLFHVGTPAASYDLVQFHGEESDIVDYGLSIDDCAAILPAMRAAGHSVTCETASR